MSTYTGEVMCDLETFGNGPTAVITAIGCVRFNRETMTVDKANGFYEVIDVQSCVDAGLTMDVGTVLWWMNQSDAARSIYTSGKQRPKLGLALDALMGWYNGQDMPTWGNGSTFDNVILRSAFKACGLDAPWSYWNDRCYRTLKSEYPNVKMARVGTHHNAYDDAVSQANHLLEILSTKQGVTK